MGAGHMINLNQLTMRAGQIKNAAEPEDVGGKTVAGQWAVKTKESKVPGDVNSDTRWHGAGVYDDIKKHGVKNPVQLYEKGPGYKEFLDSPLPPQKYMMGDGHHRVAAGAAIEEETGHAFHVPVHIYYDRDRLPGVAPGTARNERRASFGGRVPKPTK